MPEHGIRSTYSQCPFQLLMYDEGGVISSGTGFFYETDNRWFLVTNWHNVTGRDFQTGRVLSPLARVPTRLVAKLSTYTLGGREGSFAIEPHEVRLYDGTQPCWREHREAGTRFDIVAIPWERPQTCPAFMHNAANRISNDNIPVVPGCTVFVVGFPKAISVGIGLPLWKSGYVASEPHYDVTLAGTLQEFGGLSGGLRVPAFFIDAQTREGMSGSPVFARHYGTWDMSDPYRPIDPDEPGFWDRDDVALWGSQGTQFVGCYSGRIASREDEAALGLCWRRVVIEAICRNGKPGELSV